VEATRAPFEAKDLLKSRQYRWNPQKRVWGKFISEKELESEKMWLREKIYAGKEENPASFCEVEIHERFKGE